MMKKVYPIVLTLLLVNSFSFAALKTWTGGTVGNKNWTTGANWSGGTAPAGGDDIVFNTAGTITFTTMPANVSYNSLTISQGTVILSHTTGGGGRTLTLGGIAGTDFTIALGASLTLSTNVNITMAANATGAINGTLTVNLNSTFNSASNAGVLTTVNGTIINSGTVSGTAARLNFTAGSTYQHARDGGSVPSATWNVTSTCYVTGTTGNFPTNLDASTFGNVTWNCPAQTVQSPSPYNNPLVINGNLLIQNTGTGYFRFGGSTPQVNTIAQDFTITGGTVKISGNTGRTVTLLGNFSISSGAGLLMDDNNTNAVFNIAGNFTHSGTIYETGPATQSVINFNGTATQTYIKNPGAINSNQVNYAILNNAIVDFGTYVLDGTGGTQGYFNLQAGGTIITAHPNGINSAGASGTIQLTGARTFSSAANYEYSGSAVQNSGIFTTSPTANLVNRLTISNTAGTGTTGVTLQQSLSVGTNLNFTSGVLTTTTPNIVILNAAATVTGYGSTISGSSDRFVNGPMRKIGISTSYLFPVGTVVAPNSFYAPIAVSNMTGLAASDYMTAQHFSASSGNNALINNNGHTTPAAVYSSYIEYWSLTSNKAGITGNVSLYFPHYNYSVVYDKGNGSLRVMSFTGGQWKDLYNDNTTNPDLVTTDSDAGNFITSNGNANPADLVTSFGLFTFGATGPSGAPLPVVLRFFNATKENGYNNLHWLVSCTGNGLSFELQRSNNNRDYKAIASLSADNIRCGSPFDYKDYTASGNKIYYRIKITDENGKVAYTYVRIINNTNKGFEIISILPNPASHFIMLNVNSATKEQLDINIIDMSGKIVVRRSNQVNTGNNLISLDINNLPAGAYTITGVYSTGKIVSQKFIKQ